MTAGFFLAVCLSRRISEYLPSGRRSSHRTMLRPPPTTGLRDSARLLANVGAMPVRRSVSARMVRIWSSALTTRPAGMLTCLPRRYNSQGKGTECSGRGGSAKSTVAREDLIWFIRAHLQNWGGCYVARHSLHGETTMVARRANHLSWLVGSSLENHTLVNGATERYPLDRVFA